MVNDESRCTVLTEGYFKLTIVGKKSSNGTLKTPGDTNWRHFLVIITGNYPHEVSAEWYVLSQQVRSLSTKISAECVFRLAVLRHLTTRSREVKINNGYVLILLALNSVVVWLAEGQRLYDF